MKRFMPIFEKMHFKLCVCLHGLFVHGLTCFFTQEVLVQKPMASISFEHDCVSVLDIRLNPQKSIGFPDYSTRQWAWVLVQA